MKNYRWLVKGNRLLQLPGSAWSVCAVCAGAESCLKPVLRSHVCVVKCFYNHFSYRLLLSLRYLVKKG